MCKSKILLIVILIPLFLDSGSCKKEPLWSCQVEHPEENLPWLKEGLKSVICKNVYQCFFGGTEYIILEDCEMVSDRTETVFECNGNLVCQHGGMLPGVGGCNLPASFWDNYNKNKVLLYKKMIDSDEIK
jgi:hypothetical protein